MSDGQTQLGESIQQQNGCDHCGRLTDDIHYVHGLALCGTCEQKFLLPPSEVQQNAQPVSIKLERGESVKWHDGEQWRLGHVLTHSWILLPCLVQTVDGVYVVMREVLQPYGQRCERCDGSGLVVWDNDGHPGTFFAQMKCPDCQGSGSMT